MSHQFLYEATRLFVTTDQVVGSNSTLQMSQAPVRDPVSHMINNIRFGVNGFANSGLVESSVFWLSARQRFQFVVRDTGTFSAQTLLQVRGGYSLVARKSSWWFDIPGKAGFFISVDMRVRVSRDKTELLDFTTPSKRICEASVEGTGSADAIEDELDMDPLSTSIQQDFISTLLIPRDRVRVEARFYVQASASDGADFQLDFGELRNGGLSDGLNAPAAFITIDS